MIALAVATGIPMSAWVEAGERAIVTAFALLDQQSRQHSKGDPQTSG